MLYSTLNVLTEILNAEKLENRLYFMYTKIQGVDHLESGIASNLISINQNCMQKSCKFNKLDLSWQRC